MEEKFIQNELLSRLNFLDSTTCSLSARFPLSALLNNGIAIHPLDLSSKDWFSVEAIEQAFDFSNIDTFIAQHETKVCPPYRIVKSKRVKDFFMENIFKNIELPVSAIPKIERTRSQSNPNLFNLRTFREGYTTTDTCKGIERQAAWPVDATNMAFRTLMIEIMNLLVSPDFIIPGCHYDIDMVKPALLRSDAEHPDILRQNGGDLQSMTGQSWHRDFQASQFPRMAPKRSRFWNFPGLVILVCLYDNTRFRVFTKSNRVAILRDHEWIMLNGADGADDGEVLEITLHKGCIFIMHGLTIHAGCVYAALNLRFCVVLISYFP